MIQSLPVGWLSAFALLEETKWRLNQFFLNILYMHRRQLTLLAVLQPSRQFRRYICTETRREKTERHKKKIYTCILQLKYGFITICDQD